MVDRNLYTKEFKEETVQLIYKSNKTIKEIASDIIIRYQLLCKWKRKFEK